jgi:UDP-N-acetylglucosamine:LPS N-acetylglucosamine transferase
MSRGANVANDRAEGALKVMLVCSSGGHLLQLHRLKPWWEKLGRVWVTFDKPDSRSLLAGEDVRWAYHPTTRSVINLVRNLGLAWRLLRRNRPDVVVSTGAGVAFPFFLLARVFGIKTVYVEVYDRIDVPTLTGRLCYPLASRFLLQWEAQKRFYPRGEVIGRLL